MAFFVQPQDIVNRSLDAIGAGTLIGNMDDGTKESEAARRAYGPLVRQLLQTANWAFARKAGPLQVLADATGQTIDPNTNLPITTTVEPPWTYAYAWPIDGVRARWLPWNLSPAGSTVPLMTGLATAAVYPYQRPARFLVATSEQYPTVTGSVDWDSLPDISSTEGVGLTGRRIILTNITQAQLVYTKLVLEIEQWDELFTEAMVAVMGMRLAMVAIDDRKLAVAMRSQQIAIAQNAIREARVANANNSGFPQSVSRDADWISFRDSGTGWGWAAGDGPGYTYLGWAGFPFDGGSVF